MRHPAPNCDWLTSQAYAHRGLHQAGVPENSLAAFEAAIEAGLGIECDVRKSADGRAMVFHDDQLDRLTDATGPVDGCTVGELTAISLSGSDQHLPTLRDMLDTVAGRVPILLELKTNLDRPIGPLCKAVRRDCEGYSGAIAVMSFDPRVSSWFAQRLPSMVRGLVMTEEGGRTLIGGIRRRLAVRHAQPHFLAYDIRDLPSAFAARQQAKGLPLLSWTVRTAALLETAQHAGATPILEGTGVAAWQSRP